MVGLHWCTIKPLIAVYLMLSDLLHSVCTWYKNALSGNYRALHLAFVIDGNLGGNKTNCLVLLTSLYPYICPLMTSLIQLGTAQWQRMVAEANHWLKHSYVPAKTVTVKG